MPGIRAPIYEALLRYRAESNLLLHMPGHCGGRGFTVEEFAELGRLDFTEVPGLDDLHNPTGPLQEARELMAAAFGAQESFFLVNGATSGIQTLFLATCNEGEPVLIPRNAHRSFLAGLVLSGAVPVYYPCIQADPWGIVVAPEAGAVVSALEKNPAAAAIFLASPSYYGTVADVREIVQTAQNYDKMVLVDEAHGAHFSFHPCLPPPALAQGSAAVVHGMHKTLPVLTQAAMLHIGCGFIPRARLRQAYHLLTTTSPSYPLLASLDLARSLLQERGYELLEKALQWAGEFRFKMKQVKGIDCPGEEFLQVPGVKGYDPLKVLLGVRGLSLTGYQVAVLLRERFNIQVEMAGRDFILAMFSLYHDRNDWEELYVALRSISQQYPGPGEVARLAVSPPPLPDLVLTPRQAYYSPWKKVKLAEAVGRIAGEMVAGYPPGIPCLLPGELVTPEVLDYLFYLRANGAGIHGPEDPELNYLYIIDEI
ncbi:MAG: aminotransferase class I/II-fold pyridoxal phosphate-dependent enzyme [Syntrophomonadaceae bacterium]|nr:aminotransferase class I/II-fold pyridoxal phosphate-dependent enzyme [Syntrophomonadaceae bacterium]